MKLLLQRLQRDHDVTIGELSIQELRMWTREEATRAKKLSGFTAVPKGTYAVELTYSMQFSRNTPEIMRVPETMGVRIIQADASGHVQVGMMRKPKGVGRSKEAFDLLMLKLRNTTEPLEIEIR